MSIPLQPCGVASLTRSVSAGERSNRLGNGSRLRRSPSLTLFEVARFESREATSADSLGRKPKDLLEIVLLAAKRRQQSARQQFAAAASRLSDRFQHFSAG